MLIKKIYILLIVSIVCWTNLMANETHKKRIAYLVSDISIPFWQIMAKGIAHKANILGYEIKTYSAQNNKKRELQNVFEVMQGTIDGVIISPINSSTAVTMLKFFKQKNIPAVISDIGTDGGEYVSFISSDNKQGAYDLGKILVTKMQELSYDKDGSVGIVAIPQKRANGKARTDGFVQALKEANIEVAGLLQQVDFSYEETYLHSLDLIRKNKNLKAIWLQGSDKYKGALDAIEKSGKQGEILLICFDAEPEFVKMIKKGTLVGAAMQQPYLMGEKSVEVLHNYLLGQKVKKYTTMDILPVSTHNIEEKLPLIRRNVLGLE